MKYALLICDDPTLFPNTPEEQHQLMGEFAAFTNELIASGEIVSGERLDGVDTATSVRVRDGRLTITDGPFAQTQERLGGYYIVDVAHLDRALELAAKVPSARTGVVEVRPVLPTAP